MKLIEIARMGIKEIHHLVVYPCPVCGGMAACSQDSYCCEYIPLGNSPIAQAIWEKAKNCGGMRHIEYDSLTPEQQNFLTVKYGEYKGKETK